MQTAAEPGHRKPGLTTAGIVGALVLLAWLLAWVVALLQTKGRALALEEAWVRVESAGAAGVAEIGARAREVAALARTLALTLETLPLREEQVRASLPKLLDFQGDGAIAGGGYWPEPFAFDPRRERRSFFWGRSAAGTLEYFDDYNVSTDAYQREEWYAPARELPPGRVHWSRTYMDPFTRQPMVTCTAPIRRGGAFHGVVTVDLRLEGLQTLAESVAKRTGGYAFVLDPQGRFVTFPDRAAVEGRDGERLGLDELASREPALVPLARTVSARPGAGLAVQRVALTGDARLREPSMAFAFPVPETGWRLVVVKPVSEGAAVASELVRILTVYLALGLTLAMGLAAFAADRLLIGPLRRTTAGVQEAGRLLAERRFDLLQAHRVPAGGVREVEVLAGVLGALSSTVGRVAGDLERARGAAESASRAKSEFLAAMSHELRTPLNQIIGYAELLEEEAQDAGREAELPDLRRIRAAALGLLGLVDDALAISQIESDKLELKAEAFDAWRAAEEVVAGARPLAEKNGNELRLLRPQGGGEARTDEAKLRACLDQLVDNACGFTHAGRVEVIAERSQGAARDELVFRVRDTGPGIPADKLEVIFERFTQLDRSFTRARDGAGLGLAVARGYAQALGGGISVESELGQGSLFTLRVPASLPAC